MEVQFEIAKTRCVQPQLTKDHFGVYFRFEGTHIQQNPPLAVSVPTLDMKDCELSLSLRQCSQWLNYQKMTSTSTATTIRAITHFRDRHTFSKLKVSQIKWSDILVWS
jgi:hypothetical protein